MKRFDALIKNNLIKIEILQDISCHIIDKNMHFEYNVCSFVRLEIKL